MPYEVCYCALLSISVVEGLKTHTTLRPAAAAARRRAAASTTPCRGPRSPHAGRDHNVSVFRLHPQDSLAGGPPARWFVIHRADLSPPNALFPPLLQQATLQSQRQRLSRPSGWPARTLSRGACCHTDRYKEHDMRC